MDMKRKRLLLILLFLAMNVPANAQKPKAKNGVVKKNTVQQKADDWQEFKQPDFTVKFPQSPTETSGVFDLADRSVRYAAADARNIVYSIDRLEFGKEFWSAIGESLDLKKTICDNLDAQQEASGATLLFRSAIIQQGASGRTSYFKLPERNGEPFDLLQNAYKKGDRVYVVRVTMPVKLMKSAPDELKDFPASVKGFLESFRFLPDVAEPNDFPPPPLPKPTGTPKN